jgi:hypothetical protein
VEAQARGGDLRVARVNWIFIFGLAAYNLVRIRNLAEATA